MTTLAAAASTGATSAGAGAGSSAYLGAASIGGGILGGLLDFPIQKSFNVKQSRHQREWMERMSNTQYQRAVQDLRAAGLNPALAYTQGGAGYSGYQQAQSPETDVDVDVGKAVSSAKQAEALDLEVQRLRHDVNRAASDAAIRANDRKSSDLYWQAMGEAEVEAVRSGAERNTAGALESLSNRNVNEQTQKIRQSDEAAAKVLEELRHSTPGRGLIILREILNSSRR